MWAVCLSLALASCGGGGGGGGSPDTTSPTAPPADTTAEAPANAPVTDLPDDWPTDPQIWAEQKEFINQPGLATVKAEEAYVRGITGRGQVIGFIDTGLDETHSEFEGKNIRLNDRSGVDLAKNEQLSHGTGVASVALGARGVGGGLHGVAFDADPAAWSLNLDRLGSLTVNDNILGNAIRALENSGARVINQSWGYSSTYDDAVAAAQQRFLEQNFVQTINLIEGGNAIHVWAAGNEGDDHPSVSSIWPLFFPDAAGYSITVAALGQDGLIGRRSNRCGVAREFCLAAPGGVAVGASAYTSLARAGGGYRRGYGTSFAAPYVSGALALMMQAFGNQLSLPEYTARLLASANKQGVYVNQAIYGQGLLDIEAALLPIGDLNIPLPSGGSARPSESRIDGGLIPSDVVDRLRDEEIILLDRLNAPFMTDLALLPQEYTDFDLTSWLTHGDNRTGASTHPFLARFEQTDKSATLGNFWQIVPLALRRSGVRQDLPPLGSIGFAATVRRRRTRFGIGWVGEIDGLMDTVGDGALKLGPSHSVMFSVGKDFNWHNDFSLTTNAHFTFSNLQPLSDSLIRGTENAISSAFDIGVDYYDFNLQLSQPIYFETGVLKLSRPNKRRADGAVVFQADELPLRSAQRPVQFSLTRDMRFGQIGLKLEKNSGAPPQYGFAWKAKF
ncbi:MAG: Extracellular serine protease [Alphaproteobacteria bacterium]|nr:MAG: Extracellular serine protease [Alphaproteobacteria bacterium]